MAARLGLGRCTEVRGLAHGDARLLSCRRWRWATSSRLVVQIGSIAAGLGQLMRAHPVLRFLPALRLQLACTPEGPGFRRLISGSRFEWVWAPRLLPDPDLQMAVVLPFSGCRGSAVMAASSNQAAVRTELRERQDGSE